MTKLWVYWYKSVGSDMVHLIPQKSLSFRILILNFKFVRFLNIIKQKLSLESQINALW